MKELGDTLREARERLGLALDEVERATRIRTHHLDALERGEFEALPSPVQARGFLNNYADFLGLDANQILLRYTDILQAARTRPLKSVPVERAPTRPSVRVQRRSWLTTDLLVSTVITLAILGVIGWGISRVAVMMQANRQQNGAAAGILIPSMTPTATTSAPLPFETPQVTTEATPTSAPAPIFVNPGNAFVIEIVAEHSAWVRYVLDGGAAVTQRLLAGSRLSLNGAGSLELSTGNAAALRVYFNGQDQGTLGKLNEVTTRIWTINGMLTPTPTPSPTPTEAPLISPTPTSTG